MEVEVGVVSVASCLQGPVLAAAKRALSLTKAVLGVAEECTAAANPQVGLDLHLHLRLHLHWHHHQHLHLRSVAL